MKREKLKNFIVGTILVFILILNFSPLQTESAALNWDNPNSSITSRETNPYKFKISDYFSSQTMMSVVGCTGVVNKIAGGLQNVSLLLTGNLKEKKEAIEAQKQKTLDAMCKLLGLTATGAASTAPLIDINDVPKTVTEYCASKKVADPTLALQSLKELEIQKANQFREECLNGIAYNLAKNQLTSMTKQTMNWVTTGFNGDPMYVRNVTNFMKTIEDEVAYKELESIKDLNGIYNSIDYPFGRDFSTSYIKSRQSAKNFAESSKQDLTNFLTRGATIQDFANDFSKGGWNAWLGLTQRANNNPLGYTMNASQYIADKQAIELQIFKDEIAQNDGMLSQKKCKVTAATKKAGEIKIARAKANSALALAEKNYQEVQTLWLNAKTPENIKIDGKIAANEKTIAVKKMISDYELKDAEDKLAEAQRKVNTLNASVEKLTASEDCAEWEIVTPGSLIQDKISNYLGSPERQLEMADDINSVLNSLFANLIAKLRLDGLSSLNSESFSNVSGGFGSNSWTTPVNFTDSNGDKFAGNGLNPNRAFDLTKDLGNIYITADKNNLGYWNASTNVTEKNDAKNIPSQTLYPQTGAKSIAVEINGVRQPAKVITNGYFTVRTQGDAKLINDTYNAWAEGDRAFWDGESWQNWKKGQPNPILKRGIIQLQQDYIVGATELLQNLPAIMPKLGELDYCIPGPNPNWQTNYADASVAFNEYVANLDTNYIGTGFFSRDRISIDAPSENFNNPVYKNYKAVFSGSNIWQNLANNNSIYVSIHALGKSRSDGLWKGKNLMEAANLRVKEMKMIISEMFEVFNKDFEKGVTALHKDIKERYIRDEKTFGLIDKQKPNPNFIEMSADGLNITKDILFYNNEINDANESLKAAIAQADININKLELLRKEVSKIIIASQDRRKAELEIILQKIMDLNPSMNRAQALVEYNRCLKEEDTSFIDSGDILIDVKNTERCSDKLDNDLDGYVDMDDSDCGVNYVDSYVKQHCIIGESVDLTFEKTNDQYYNASSYSSNIPCISRTDFNSCQNSYFSSGSTFYSCEWESEQVSAYVPYIPYNGQSSPASGGETNGGGSNVSTSGETIYENKSQATKDYETIETSQ